VSENEAITLAQGGDPDAFRVLYDSNFHYVLTVTNSILKNPDEAEDLTQEIFLLLWQKIKSFDRQSKFQTWLYYLIKHKTLNYKRYKERRLACGAGDYPEIPVAPTQHARLEAIESYESLSDLQKLCIEAEIEGNSLRRHGGKRHLQEARRQIA
jgi:RNA polymerase sigma factor (sigma-70 family)